jgi:hypothetical protein
MAGSLTDLILNLGSITGLGMEDINGNSSVPRARPGTVFIGVDAFGVRIFKYCRMAGTVVVGSTVSKVANAAVNNILSGGTLQATTTGLTAGLYDGKLAYVLDYNASAGAAPEGEVSVVSHNSTTVISFERDYPLSVALAVNDDLVIVSNWHATASADGDLSVQVLGVVVANAGVTAGNYGWVQQEGYCLVNRKAASVIVVGDPVVSDAATFGLFGSDGQELWVGYALAGATADQVNSKVLTNLKLFTVSGPGTAP